MAPIFSESLKNGGTYYEPFLGSGAMFFALAPEKAVLSDINAHLIETFRHVARDPKEVICNLSKLLSTKEAYNEIRLKRPDNELDEAVRFIYLNRNSFGGLYRENKNGEFNVPFGGGQRNHNVLLKTGLLERSASLLNKPGIVLQKSDFQAVLKNAGMGDVVFCDPTYRKVDRTHFDRYGQNVFDWKDQMRLYHAALDAYHRGALVVVSNALCPELETLYAEAGILKLMRPKGLGPDRKPQNVEESAFVLDPLRRWSEWKKVGKLILPKKRARQLSMLPQANIQIAAKDPENGKVLPKGQQKEIVPGTISLTQEERAKKNGISLMSQRRLDKIARLRPELLNKIAKSELSIKGALKLCEQPQEKIEKNPSVDQLKRVFSNLSEEEKDQFQDWIVFNRSPLKETHGQGHKPNSPPGSDHLMCLVEQSC